MRCSKGESAWKSKKAQTQDRFLRGRQIACVICEHFRVTGAHEAVLDLTHFFLVSLQGDDIQDFDTRWDQVLLGASERPTENVLESLYKMRIRESLQLQTVLAMYEQEIDQHRSKPSDQKLKTMVRRHIDRMIRTPNFKVRNERIETGVLVKSQKGKNVSVENEDKENAISAKHMDSVQEETPVVSATEQNVDNQHNRPLLLQDRRRQKTEGEAVHPERKVKERARMTLKGIARIRRVFILRRTSTASRNGESATSRATTHSLHDRATICTCMSPFAKICTSSRSDLMTFRSRTQ